MPTLIRLVIVLVILAGLGFAGMLALTTMVDPGEKEVTLRIPARELVPPASATTIDLDNLPAPVNVVPREESAPPPAQSADDVQTIAAPGTE
jgi:hypothetical protein